MKKVRTYTNDEGIHISTLGSYLAWTSITNEMQMRDAKLEFDELGICKYCNGTGVINTDEYGEIRCICKLAKKEQGYSETVTKFGDLHPDKDLAKLEIWGDENSQRDLRELKKMLEKWRLNPDKWITLMGLPGSGKSHVLMALDNYFHPWSMYITATSLESRFYQALDDNSLPLLIDTIKRVPILLLDDIGSDYGKEYVRANLRKIIDYRYMNYLEYPTVIATNYWKHEIKNLYDMRIGDRILDEHIAHVIELEVNSWRINHD